ncbi:threonine ammonia-lyase [Caulobacter vibrioides]|uniref:Threonine dehydratase n=2 Tax=Caulobacter vibrioides TaxID=155892 RepID=Q9A3U7_CAUVC|nr:threonine/serine dehydratase [Caulobacter vibrioides]YP_002518576.1 threonine/serine dehydratase [Caulobacter vibrioides NA1000]AAK25067.1 threonine dehydratase [Caulobacter vibrioides CB15]ACL96668.1 threonine/serine dehydratase [Caulobacter vibrioides NA1000]ATC29933.1 threonine/serine dehydratase [Caulobacter vibrioides]QXZ51453.1 threonine/serine dehydratase [Caulobacter vibrioides]
MTVSLADIQAAAVRLKGSAVETPLIESPALNDRLGGRIFLKPETLQRAGAFKFRGAYNRLSQLSDEEKARGVVAFSSGNHAQGVALAARLLGVPALIVMPSDSPSVKVEGTRGFGADIRFYDRFTEDRVAIADQIAAERGCVVVPSYDDPHIIAGQGTVGLEIVAQAAAQGATLDRLICCVGGGGLIAGTSTAVKALSPATEIWGVEPAGFDETRRSLESGRRETIDKDARSICDALLTPIPGDLTWPINQKNLSGVVAVTDAEVAEAMRYAFSTLKLVVEPGGCVALTAALTGKVDVAGKTVAIVLSGGNVDPGLFAQVLGGQI